jgi:acetyl esterase/lipase
MAKTIASSDTSTSTVIDGSGAQIQCGKTQLTSYSDILYDTPTSAGKQVPLKLDLQVPKTSGKKPLVVYITGGGFSSANKSGNLDQRTYVAEQGYVVASIEYRTVTDGATYKDSVADVKSAIRYLRAHAAQYGINPNEVAVWGQSAGGYLAAMTGVTNGLAQFEDGGNPGQSSTVQAVVDEFGPSDIAKVAADYDVAAQQANYVAGNSLAQFVIGIGTKLSVEDDPAADAAASPLTYVTASSPPFVLLHGSADQLVSPSQTLILHNALRAKGVDSTRYVVKGANHGDLTFMGGDPNAAKQWSSQQVMGDIVSFLSKHLGG